MGEPGSDVDLDGLSRQLQRLGRLMAAHGGSIELDCVSPDGSVRVAFRGLCAACALRPVTLLALIRPALLAVDGVTSVEATGVRVSAEAEARLVGGSMRSKG